MLDGPAFPQPAPFVPFEEGRAPDAGRAKGGFAGGVLLVLSCLLLLASSCALVAVPLLEVPMLAAAPDAARQVVAAIASSLGPARGDAVAGVLANPWLSLPDVAGLVPALFDSPGLEGLGIAVAAALAVLCAAALTGVAAVVASAVLRRSTPFLVGSCAAVLVCSAAAVGAVALADVSLTEEVRSVLEGALPWLGADYLSTVHVVAPTPWAISIGACSLVALVLSVWSRRRGGVRA